MKYPWLRFVCDAAPDCTPQETALYSMPSLMPQLTFKDSVDVTNLDKGKKPPLAADK
jgi:hypothetical protein